MILNLVIEKVSQPIEIFACPEMSLSSARADMVPCNFSISLSEEDLIALISKDYQELISELKQDDKQVGSPQDKLGEAGYPPLLALIKNEELLQNTLDPYLFESLISTFSKPSSTTQYWYDKIFSCKYKSGIVEISGVCFSKKTR